MSDQLPAIIKPGAFITPNDTYIVLALIADAGDAAGWRYVEFFTANIRNPHTRRAYARACARFFAWCEERGLPLTAVRPYDGRHLYRGPTAGALDAGRKAAARCRADAVRLADYRPGAAHQPGGGGTRAEAYGQDRQAAGARG